ncbi:MAG: PKD domain-containing protein [Candidatus Zhuqueibacterota bacterium]
MKKVFLFTLMVSILLTSFVFGQDAKMYRGDRTTLQTDVNDFVGYVPNAIVVKFSASSLNTIETSSLLQGITGNRQIDALNQKYNVRAFQEMFPNAETRFFEGKRVELAGYYRITFKSQLKNVEQVVAEYEAIPGVEKAEPIGVHAVHADPNDGNYSDQWHLNQTNDNDVDAPEAWDVETGNSSIIVGILDTGVRYFHKDLGGANASYSNPQGTDGNMWINWTEKNGTTGVDDDGNGYVDDWVGWDFVNDADDYYYPIWPGEDGDVEDNDPRDFNGHGTHCAGNVGAINNNGYATCAPSGGWGSDGNGVKVMALRVGWSVKYLRKNYEVGLIRMDFAAQAMYYAANNGAKIISCSWGSSNSGGIEDALNYFVGSGGLIFKSAGNSDNESTDFMTARSDVIAVAASDQNDCRSDFSSYGTWVDITAPGTDILSLYENHADTQNDYVATLSGTSMASPLAASVAALIWSQNPGQSANDVKQKLFDTADNIYTESCNASYAGKLGAGRVNAFEAVSGSGPVAPTAQFSGAPVSGNAPLVVNFTDMSTGTVESWSWNFGDGGTSTSQNPSHTYSAAGTYSVELTVTGPAGSDSELKTNYITVTIPAPVAAFSGTPTSGTAPLNVSFTDASTGNISSWSWNFGDGGASTAQNPSHSYAAVGTYTVALTVTGPGGSDTETKTNYITVNPEPVPPVAAFSGVPTSGNAPLSVVFTDASTGDVTSWSWTFGDGGTSTAENPTHVYNAAGAYTVALTVTGPAGSDTETKTNYITVTVAAPVAAFSGTPTSGTVPLTVNFTDASTGSVSSWSWNFGDGGMSTAQNPSHQYTTAGTYTVSLTVTGPGGSDTETKTNYITVNAQPVPPVAQFSGSPTSGTAPLAVNFTDASTGQISSWSWNFGDGGTSTQQNPSHTYSTAGTYTVALTVTGPGGSDTETKASYITVNPGAQNLMHVNDVKVTKIQVLKKWNYGKAEVQIVDQNGAAVSNATVTGEWTQGASGTATFTTGSNGWGSVSTSYSKTATVYCFRVTNVTKTDWTYDSEANVETWACSDGSSGLDISLPKLLTSQAPVVSDEAQLDEDDIVAYPNPFNSSTVITFFAPSAGRVTVDIYNILGEKITTLIDQEVQVGPTTVRWNGTNANGDIVSGGYYFYNIRFNTGQTITKKMLYLK